MRFGGLRLLSIHAAMALLLLAGCASRPGSGVLQPVAATVSGADVVTVHAVTTRQHDPSVANTFAGARTLRPNYVRFTISVPPTHEMGAIEWPKNGGNPETDFVTLASTELDHDAFMESLDGERGSQRNVFLFVHGYNYNFPEALYRLTQMAADSGIDSRAVLFAWPSIASPFGYVADRESATFSRDALASTIREIAGDPDIGQLTVFAHSMGGWLAIEAIRQLRLTGDDAIVDGLEVVLAAPDIDIDVFRAQMQVIGPLDKPMRVFVSPDDRALFVSDRLGGGQQRLGQLDVDDPRVQQAAREADIAIVDISNVAAPTRLNHDRYVNLAGIYADLAREDGTAPDASIQGAGAFIFEAIGGTISAPFRLVSTATAAPR
jgi:esterase/lipase superfamily enzyme